MEPKSVRIACPECTWDVIVPPGLDPTALPPGIVKMVEGTFFCPNCTDVPMKPVASVDTTPKPKAGITAAVTVEQITSKVVELGREVETYAEDLKEAAEIHKDAKKAYDAKVITLRLAVERLGRVVGGEQIEADLPLLEIAEQEPGRCDSVHVDAAGAGVQCQGEAGHGGPHGNGNVTWSVLDNSVMTATVQEAAETLRQRLAALHIVVETAEIEAWSLSDYDAVLAYVAKLETPGLAVDSSERPAVLPIEPPEHVVALHRALAQVGVVVAFDIVCGWTKQQRDDATVWALKTAESGDTTERPEFIPAPSGEAERTISRRHKDGPKRRRRGPVEEPEIEAETLANA